MGVLPLQFLEGESAASLELTGDETFTVSGIEGGGAKTVTVTTSRADGRERHFQARVRIDTPNEVEYYRHGGILHYVLRKFAV